MHVVEGAGHAGPVPDVVAPPPGHRRFPLFDALRALAVFGVLGAHAALLSGALATSALKGPLAHLDIGVTIFFVLSGFLLYRPFVAARRLGAAPVRLRDYGWRRFLRIAPGYWVALTLLTLWVGLEGVFTDDWWVFYGLLQNYPVYEPSAECVANPLACGISPAWSLAVEVAFYVTLPLYVIVAAALTRRASTPAWLAVEAGLLGGLAALSFYLQTVPHGSEFVVWVSASPLGAYWWFALGMGLAVASVALEGREGRDRLTRLIGERPWLPWALAAALFLLLTLALVEPVPLGLVGFVGGRSEQLTAFGLYGVIALLLVLPAAICDREGGAPRALLASRPASWLGIVSYGVFLWHFPLLLWLVERGALTWVGGSPLLVLAAAGAAIATACGAASYYLVERPVLRLKSHPPWRMKASSQPPPREGAPG